jgi:predicted TIM-barrel fold metal-dependent hydrolase
MTTVQVSTGVDRREASKATWIIDCDVHNALRAHDDLKPYLAKRWHVDYDHKSHIGSHGGLTVGARPSRDIFRQDAFPARGVPGSDLDLMRDQFLDPFNVSQAVLSPLEVLTLPTYGEAAAAFMDALNHWMIDEWLDRDDRLYGAISVPVEDGTAAADVIARAAERSSRFVAVLVTMVTREGFGHPKYWPIYKAASDRGLPVIAHVGGFSGTHMSNGWPTYFVENHSGWTQPYAAQIVSLIYSGMFDRFPKLQVVLEEGGIGWMPSLMWRLDRTWKAMREHTPHLKRPPSEVIREHVWFTTQPLDAPEKPEYLGQTLEQMDMSERIMFASDYPHWDFDDPNRVLPKSLGDELRDQILRTNAQRLYGFVGGVA